MLNKNGVGGRVKWFILAHSSTKNKNKDILDQNLVATARKVRCGFHQDNNAYTQIYNMF